MTEASKIAAKYDGRVLKLKSEEENRRIGKEKGVDGV